MRRKKRGYKRETPVELLRDYKLFVIACEGGKREPDYFNVFQFLSKRISVDVIEDIVSDEEMKVRYSLKSAPKWVLDRAVKYIEKEGLNDEDELWFVMDKDRWTDDQIRQIATLCDDQNNWNIAISNPCFEVWLYFHMNADISKSASIKCNDFKTEISVLTKGGYHPLKFISSLPEAVINARNADSDLNHFMPKEKETKIYKLGETILDLVGPNEFAEFLSDRLPKLVQIEVEKTKASKRKKAR